MSAKITIELSDSDAAELQAKADALNISLGEATAQYVAYCLDYDRWYHAAVQEGLASAERGELMDQEEVFAELRARMGELVDTSK